MVIPLLSTALHHTVEMIFYQIKPAYQQPDGHMQKIKLLTSYLRETRLFSLPPPSFLKLIALPCHVENGLDLFCYPRHISVQCKEQRAHNKNSEKDWTAF